MEFSIRRADAGDGAGIASVVSEFQRMVKGEARPTDEIVKMVEQQIAESLTDEGYLMLVAVGGGGKIVGYAAVHWLPYMMFGGVEGYLSELYVLEDFRDGGVGGRLLDEVVSEAKGRGCFRLMLVNRRDRESYKRGFYRKHGWEEREEAVNFIYEL